MSLDEGAAKIAVPPPMRVVKQSVAFETDAYKVERTSDGKTLGVILVGGGSYELKKYSRFCRFNFWAWRRNDALGEELLLGDPGTNAVDFTFRNLSPHEKQLVRHMIASARIRWGQRCQP